MKESIITRLTDRKRFQLVIQQKIIVTLEYLNYTNYTELGNVNGKKQIYQVRNLSPRRNVDHPTDIVFPSLLTTSPTSFSL